MKAMRTVAKMAMRAGIDGHLEPQARDQIRTIEQMMDQGDAAIGPELPPLHSRRVISRNGEEWVIWYDYEETDEQPGAGGSSSGDGHHLCGVGAGNPRVDQSAMTSRGVQLPDVGYLRPHPLARACALLEECLDWIGLEDISRRERVLAVEVQQRIARLLAEVREG